jgi:hypothetical protein
MRVYLLQHVRTVNDDEDIKVLGIYSSEALALEAVERFRKLPGFAGAPDGFSVDAYDIDQDHWTSGYVSWADAARKID